MSTRNASIPTFRAETRQCILKKNRKILTFTELDARYKFYIEIAAYYMPVEM